MFFLVLGVTLANRNTEGLIEPRSSGGHCKNRAGKRYFLKNYYVLMPAAAAHTETVFISGLELMLNEWMRPWCGFR